MAHLIGRSDFLVCFLLIAWVLALAGPAGSAESGDAILIGLGDLPGGGFTSEADGLSADGSVVVGRSLTADGWEAFRWESGNMFPLDRLPGGFKAVTAVAASDDGSEVVGIGSDGKAFYWGLGGIQRLDSPGDAIVTDVSGDGSMDFPRNRGHLGG